MRSLAKTCKDLQGKLGGKESLTNPATKAELCSRTRQMTIESKNKRLHEIIVPFLDPEYPKHISK